MKTEKIKNPTNLKNMVEKTFLKIKNKQNPWQVKFTLNFHPS
jgi:hypothetical protein